jgi:IS5 family transposase
MHQTKKGTEQHFGMKAHLGVDSKTKVIHALPTTPATVADSAVLGDLLQGRRNKGMGRSSLSRPEGRHQSKIATGLWIIPTGEIAARVLSMGAWSTRKSVRKTGPSHKPGRRVSARS